MTCTFILLQTLLIGSVAQSLGASATPKNPPAPNIVLIYADDLGYTDLACYGSELHRTPNLDKLAAGGKRFTNAYANAPNCAPSRACLMSGQYGPRHGIYTVGSSQRGKANDRKLTPVPNETVLKDDIVTLPEVLREAGYACAQIGKWHLGKDPRSQGFDLNVAGGMSGHPKSYFSPYSNPNLEDGEDGEYLTDRLTDESIDFIQANRAGRFFLYLSHYAVHTPIQSKPELKALYSQRNARGNHGYAAMVDSLDQSVGRIVACLERLGLREQTLILFTSDNGGHGSVTSMAPLRGAKGMLYEGGIREPFLVNWPGQVAAGTTEDAPIIGTDLFPTLAGLAGAAIPETKVLDGVDLRPLFFGQGPIEDRSLFWHFPAYLEAGRALKGTTPFRTTPVGAVRHGTYKLIEFFEGGKLELYNLAEDLSEARNLVEAEPERVKQLHGLLKSWRQETGAPIPTPKTE